MQDFAYASFALGLGYNHFQSDPDVRAATERRDAIAVEQMFLDKTLLIPIFHY